jgi:hypothetical protein
MWRALVDLGAQHRQFPDADWAMPGDVVDRVEAVAAHVAPTSPVDLAINLFDHGPHLPGVDPLGPDYEQALRTARQDAARAVLDAEGISGLLRLGATATLPIAVGWSAAEVRGDDLADDLLPLLGSDGSDGWVAQGYAGGRIQTDGLDWLVRQLQRWPDGDSVPQQVGLLLAVTRPNEDLVIIVNGLHTDVQAAFWLRMNAIFVDPAARPLVARTLLEHRRPWGAIDLLVTMFNAPGGDVEPDVDLVEAALMSAATGPSDDSPNASSLSWEIGQLLDFLERSGSDVETRARLEFLYAYSLQLTRPARALNDALATDPALFAEVVSYVYVAHGADPSQVPPEQSARAMVGFTVLREWSTPPGLRRDETVDGDALRAWVTEARRLLAASGRTVPGDLAIGRALAYAPADSDSVWPAEAVRDLVEELRSSEFEAGLHNGAFRSRGMVFRSLDDGGAQERALAVQHPAWADRVSDGGPTPELSCARSRTTSTSGVAGRMISPSASGTMAPEPRPRGRPTWVEARRGHRDQRRHVGGAAPAARQVLGRAPAGQVIADPRDQAARPRQAWPPSAIPPAGPPRPRARRGPC